MEAIWVAAEMRAGAVYAHSALALDTIAAQQDPGEIPDAHAPEHVTLKRLVRLLDGEMSLRAAPCAPDIALLIDALYYLTRFPDVSHHMIEDRIVERLLAKHALPASFGHEVGAQHAALFRQGRELLQDLEAVVREENMSQELVAIHIREYARLLQRNMDVEEAILFPTAVRRLNGDDFRAIALPDVYGQQDPLLQTPVDERFAQLRRVIANEAGCGCGGDDL